jgi:predicted branched-subunit amino acid permease
VLECTARAGRAVACGVVTPSDLPLSAADRRRVDRDAVGVGIAVGAYGVSFGAVAIAAGLTPAQTCALSLFAFTGASQFALVAVLGAGGGAAAGVASALLLGTRNTLYGVRLAGLVTPRRRALSAVLVIDESAAMAGAQPTPAAARRAFFATGLAVYVLWNAATLVGAVGAAALGDPRDLGLDAAVPAAFLALLTPRLRGRRPVTVTAAAVLVTLAVVPWTPAGLPVLLAALVAVPGALLRRRRAAT